MSFSIAIDGPAGAGKSTIARMLAKQLGFIYVDTGAMYRAMGCYFTDRGIAGEELSRMAEECSGAHIDISYLNGEQQVFLNGENVSVRIRSEEAGLMASACARVQNVRETLVDLQRQLATKDNVVMDGRDIGTHVLPDADLKIYLTASCQTRALRRFNELREKGVLCSLQDVEEDIRKRDRQDMEREISPLRMAEDAVLLDSSDLTVEEVLEKMKSLARTRYEK